MEQVQVALADAKARKASADTEHAELVKQLTAIQTRGTELERSMLSIDGEIKALEGLVATLGQ